MRTVVDGDALDRARGTGCRRRRAGSARRRTAPRARSRTGPAMFVMQNVVTVPLCDDLDLDLGRRAARGVRAARRQVHLVGADGLLADELALGDAAQVLARRPPGVDLVLEPDRHGDAGDRLAARSASSGRSPAASPSAIGTHASRSVTYPTRSAAQRGITRMPTLISSADATSTTCTIGTSAPSGRTSANANGFVRWCLPATGSATQVHASTTPAGPDLDELVERRAGVGVVLGRRHHHAAVGGADADDAAGPQAR